jgi:replicative DNA helicase
MEELPHNFLAEQAILSIFLNNPHLIKPNVLKLEKKSFYFSTHQLIYNAILNLIETDRTINLTNILCSFQEKGDFQKIGGVLPFKTLLNKFENPSDLDYYIDEINEKCSRRALISLGKQIIEWGYATSENFQNVLEKIEEKIAFFYDQKDSEIYSSAEVTEEIFSEIKSKILHRESIGYQTSFKDLDAILQGLQQSDLIILAGRPSMGKTAFSLNIGKNIIEKYNVPLVIFSLEMPKQQIIYRFLSGDSNISSNRIKSGRMTKQEWKKLSDSMKKISSLPIFIDDNSNVTISEIKAKLKKIFNNKKKNGLVIIDYLQLMKTNLKYENRTQEISTLTRGLKMLAKEFNVPILVLSQLSRGVESRVNKRPMLSDLRESGCISEKNIEQTFSWNKNSLYKIEKTFFSLKGIKPSYFLSSQKTSSLCFTANHKILSKLGWVEVSEINTKNNLFFISKKTNGSKKIESLNIKYKSLKIVFDKTIPLFHNYLQKNLVLHNSIEQDADVVIMLYREEYYKGKDSNSYLTEFIVAKHRNGPTGAGALAFNPKTTTFKNIEERV